MEAQDIPILGSKSKSSTGSRVKNDKTSIGSGIAIVNYDYCGWVHHSPFMHLWKSIMANSKHSKEVVSTLMDIPDTIRESL